MKFIYGQEGFLINQEVNRVIRKYGIEPIIYSNNEPLEDILLDASTASMFSNKKLLIIKNHSSFNKNDGVQEFIEGIRGNNETKMIFVYETEKLNNKSELTKFLLDVAETKEFKQLQTKDVVSTIKKIVETKGGKIDNNAIISLASKLPEDLRIIVSEIEKLLLENNHITLKMVKVSIGEYLKDDYFALSNALTSKDSYGIISAYNRKKISGEETTMIISQIASVLILSLQVYAYKKQSLTNQDISNKMKVHIFRIKKANSLLSFSDSLSIKELIKSLAKLDEEIKTGKIDPSQGIEIYLLKLIK